MPLRLTHVIIWGLGECVFMGGEGGGAVKETTCT